jgi:hypothetical protein
VCISCDLTRCMGGVCVCVGFVYTPPSFRMPATVFSFVCPHGSTRRALFWALCHPVRSAVGTTLGRGQIASSRPLDVGFRCQVRMGGLENVCGVVVFVCPCLFLYWPLPPYLWWVDDVHQEFVACVCLKTSVNMKCPWCCMNQCRWCCSRFIHFTIHSLGCCLITACIDPSTLCLVVRDMDACVSYAGGMSIECRVSDPNMVFVVSTNKKKKIRSISLKR